MLRILIADDHAIVREGLKRIVAEEPDLTVAGEARNAAEALELVRRHPWDVVILDITLPGRSGLEVLGEIRRERPRLPVLVLSMHPEDQFAVRVLKAGAAGYVTKTSAPQELLAAIRKVASGGKYISPTLADMLATSVATGSDRPPHESLSDREYEVLRGIAAGKTVSEIARQMSLSVKTISTYRARLLQKMHMKNNAELTHYAIVNRLIEP